LATEAGVVEAAEDTAVEAPEAVAEHSASTASAQTSIGFFYKANSPEAEPGPVPACLASVESFGGWTRMAVCLTFAGEGTAAESAGFVGCFRICEG
jgi:hypothetical protein